jgi:hypothetical protein
MSVPLACARHVRGRVQALVLPGGWRAPHEGSYGVRAARGNRWVAQLDVAGGRRGEGRRARPHCSLQLRKTLLLLGVLPRPHVQGSSIRPSSTARTTRRRRLWQPERSHSLRPYKAALAGGQAGRGRAGRCNTRMRRAGQRQRREWLTMEGLTGPTWHGTCPIECPFRRALAAQQPSHRIVALRTSMPTAPQPPAPPAPLPPRPRPPARVRPAPGAACQRRRGRPAAAPAPRGSAPRRPAGQASAGQPARPRTASPRQAVRPLARAHPRVARQLRREAQRRQRGPHARRQLQRRCVRVRRRVQLAQLAEHVAQRHQAGLPLCTRKERGRAGRGVGAASSAHCTALMCLCPGRAATRPAAHVPWAARPAPRA